MTKMTTIPENYNNIRAEIVELLNAARTAAARNVNSLMTATYWEIGRRIVSPSKPEKREPSMEMCSSSGWLKISRLHLAGALGHATSPR